jgi:hypothetical protein
MINLSPRTRAIIQFRFIAPAVLLAICVVNLSATSEKEISKLAKACKKDDKKACEKLKKLALEDKDASIRKLAVEAVPDQPSLAEIAIGSNDEETSLQATKKVSDQMLLATIALEGKSAPARSSAASKVVDEQSLTKLVSASNDPAVQSLAQETLNWEVADRTGTIGAYTDFLQDHPKTSRLLVDSMTLAIDHFQRASVSNSVAAGPNGEIIPNNFRTVITCEVMKDGRGTGETISIDEAEKRGFLKRDPTTGSVTAVFKQVQRKLYKRASATENANWVFVGDMKVVLEQDH